MFEYLCKGINAVQKDLVESDGSGLTTICASVIAPLKYHPGEGHMDDYDVTSCFNHVKSNDISGSDLNDSFELFFVLWADSILKLITNVLSNDKDKAFNVRFSQISKQMCLSYIILDNTIELKLDFHRQSMGSMQCEGRRFSNLPLQFNLQATLHPFAQVTS